MRNPAREKSVCATVGARLYDRREFHSALVATLDGPTARALRANRVVATGAPHFRPMIPSRIVGLFIFQNFTL
jgi:hypothetical protein